MPFATTDALPILVVDDDSALIRTLSDILKMHGYDPSTAVTGREGLELARHNPPMLAIVDLRLPDMDGMELVSRLHALSNLTEVVVLTGNATVESAVAALREHSVDYLLKPVKVDHFLNVVNVASERWQRRQVEEKLRDSDERFRRVVDSNMVGIMFWEGEDTISDANDAFLKIVGYSRDDLEGRALDWPMMTPPEYRELDHFKLRELRRDGVVAPYEKEYITKSGRRVPILFGAALLEGRGSKGVCFALDISDQKSAERALENRAGQQAAVAEFGQRALAKEAVTALCNNAVELVEKTLFLPLACIFERKSDGTALVIRACSGFDEARVGQTTVPLTVESVPGYTFVYNRPTIIADLRSDDRFTDAMLRDHAVVSGIAVVIPGPIGPYGVLSAHDRLPRSFTQDDVHFLQAIAHIVGTAIERDRSDAAFRQGQRLEAVGQLASGVAHDFNNMLTAIMGYGEMVANALPAGHAARDDVAEILGAAGRAAGLTRQLLAFSRQQVLEPKLVHLNDVISGMDKLLRRLIPEDIALTSVLAPDLGSVSADPGQIEQVILNLCVNARDAITGGGTVTVETANIDLDGSTAREYGLTVPGSYVMLAVSDTGSGMDSETRARIFEPFFTTKSPDKGTGLGLATVYGIVKQSAGELWVYSEVGRGTVFKLFLPRVDGDADAVVPAEAKAATATGTETILLAEDDEPLRRVAQRMLEQAGYTVIIARDGFDAARISTEYPEPIHLLITDMVMPGLSGPQLALQVVAARPQTRVLFLSGYTDATVVAQGLLAKDAHFLQKPFAAESLAGKVREVLARTA